MLIFLLLLLARVISLLPAQMRYDTHPFNTLVVVIMLLLNHVAFSCIRSPRLRAAAWFVAIAWLAIGLIYILGDPMVRVH
jgi:hypothetical protein